MTHDGPQGSTTAIDSTTRMADNGVIHFGSPYLAKTLKEDDCIFLNIHGHVHDGSSIDKLTNDGSVRVLNPGSLKYGEFAELFLVKDFVKDDRWRISQYNKHFLV